MRTRCNGAQPPRRRLAAGTAVAALAIGALSAVPAAQGTQDTSPATAGPPPTAVSPVTGAAATAGPDEALSATAQLEPVPDFGSNPGNLTMHRYAPEDLSADAPVVVLLHGCGQDAVEYFNHTGWQPVADAANVAVISAGQQSGNNASRCFNWFEPGDTTRDQGEAHSIKQMVDQTVEDLSADADRVYVTGLSAGGAMTASLLAAYPDVFAGGAVIAGIPHGCANGMLDAFACMNPGKSQGPSAWGDLVRAAYPDHSGARPPVSIWHGGADYVVATANQSESVKQWTNAHGIDQEADATEELPAGTTRSEYHNDSGQPLVTSYLVSGLGHGVPIAPPECGIAGSYYLDSLCSTEYVATDWGLTD